MKTPPSQQTPSGGSMRRLVLRLERWLYRFEARRLAARVEEDSYRMYCLGYPKEGRITIMEEARRFEKWAEDKFSKNDKTDPST
jgi:hypothetical protein